MVENVKNEIERIKKTKNKIGFGVNDCPLWLYKEFIDNVESKYNNVYWTKLMDIMCKAEAYDMFMEVGQVQQDQSIMVEEEDDYGYVGYSK